MSLVPKVASAGVSDPVLIEWVGEVGYAEALALQDQAVTDRVAGRCSDRVLLLEHPRVVTLGRSTQPENLRVSRDEMHQRGVETFEVGRGGDVTYHAPGQLVGYPILDLDARERRDVHDHLRRIEGALIAVLESMEIPATQVEGRTGVFVDQTRSARSEGPARKIASIGIGVRRWVTFHGFALNVSLDLTGFDLIVPCGLADVEMTSVAREFSIEGRLLPDSLDSEVRRRVAEELQVRFSGTGPEPAEKKDRGSIDE